MKSRIFIWQNDDLKEYYGNWLFFNTFEELNSNQSENILIVSWWRKITDSFLEENSEKVKLILSRWVWIDNFWDLLKLDELGILYWNNPWHSQYCAFQHSIGFLHLALEFMKISSFEELKSKKILIVWRWKIWKSILFFLKSFWIEVEIQSSKEWLSSKDIDILFLTTSLQFDNLEYLNKENLKNFTSKKSAIINLSRKELVNEKDLSEVLLINNKLLYITDVFEGEEQNNWKPKISWNIFFTNHIAWRSNNISIVINWIENEIKKILSSGKNNLCFQSSNFDNFLGGSLRKDIFFNLLKLFYQNKVLKKNLIEINENLDFSIIYLLQEIKKYLDLEK